MLNSVNTDLVNGVSNAKDTAEKPFLEHNLVQGRKARGSALGVYGSERQVLLDL